MGSNIIKQGIIGGSLRLKDGNKSNKPLIKKPKDDFLKKSKTPSSSSLTSTTHSIATEEKKTKEHHINNRENVKKTKTEIAHEKTKQTKNKAILEAMANNSHKDRVEKFNNYLSNLSEHYDVPKIGMNW